MTTINSILFLAFDKVGEQDLLAPWELLRSVAWGKSMRGDHLSITLGSFEGGTVTTQMGAKLQMDRAISFDERFDLVYIPGGIGTGKLGEDPAVLEFLRAHQREGRWIAGNCAGVGVLHRAGVLAGADITAAITLSRKLLAQGTPVHSPRRAWMIDPTHKIFTAGGAATVHPSTIALVTELFGADEGRNLATGWDTLSLHGELVFANEGPVMVDDPTTACALQDQWENVFLPVADKAA